MEWEINPDQRSKNNQPEPNPEQPIPSKPETVVKKLMPEEPIQNELTGKLPGFSYFFKETFSVYKSNFWTFLFISAIPFIASLLVSFLAVKYLLNLILSPSSRDLLLIVPIYFVLVIVSLWSSLSLLYAVKERENGINVGGALVKGWSLLGSGIWVSFLSFVIIAGGFILFIIPGIVFSVWFLLALYVLVNEDKKGMDALNRSKELISGYITAYWGRTLLFSLIFSVALLLFSFIIKLFSGFLPILDYIPTIANVMTAPLFVIFSFLVYENIKKSKESGCAKSPREIKYILISLVLFLVPIIGIFATIVLVNVNSAKTKANESKVFSNMLMLRSGIEMYWSQADSYSGVSCFSSSDLTSACNQIKNDVGQNPTIESSQADYCFYVKLTSGKYYCVDSKVGYLGGGDAIFPGGKGYCDGVTFNCP